MTSENQCSLQAAEYLKLWQTLFFLDIEHLLRHPAEIADVDLPKLADHTSCKTGQWLSVQSDTIRALPEFKVLDHAHRQFHANVAVTLSCLTHGVKHEANDSTEDVAQSHDRLADAIDQFITKLRHLGVLDVGSQSASLRLWVPSFELGIEKIDRQHRTIMTLIELASPNEASPYVGLSTDVVIRKLIRLIRAELESEAPIIQQMIKAGIDSAKDHEDAHHGLLELIASAEAGEIAITDLATTLAPWYLEHLVVYDEEMRTFCASGSGGQ